MGNGNSVMLPAKSVGTALNDVELGIGVRALCLTGIIQLHDIVLGAMDNQNWAMIRFNLLIGIHVDHISPASWGRS